MRSCRQPWPVWLLRPAKKPPDPVWSFDHLTQSRLHSLSANSPRNSAPGVETPADLIQVGYVSGAYGLQGWVRVKPYSASADALLGARVWWIDQSGLRDIDVLQAKMHSGDVVVQLMGLAGRDAAEALKGASVHIPRSHFPPLPDGEFYWIDLIGLAVDNLQGQHLGTVHDMMDNGAHPILRVTRAVVQVDGVKPDDVTVPAQEILIPFVEQFVKTVDRQGKKITVDWGLDY